MSNIRVIQTPNENQYNVFEDIFSDIEGLQKQDNEIRTLVTSESPEELKEVSGRLDDMEEMYKNFSETIVDSPEEAITARLLREEQKSLNLQISLLRDEVKSLRNRIDSFMFNTLGTALFGALFIVLIGWGWKSLHRRIQPSSTLM